MNAGGPEELFAASVDAAAPAPIIPLAAEAPPRSQAWKELLVRLLEARHLGGWLALATVCLTAPSLFIGFHLDDFIGRFIYSDLPGAKRLFEIYSGGFGTANGNPDDAHWLIEEGYAPWWIYPKLIIALMRPVSLVSHLFEFRYWPGSPVLMHAQNLLWVALLVLVTTRLYRGLHGTLVGGLAAALYAFDHAHGMAIGFIANRNALIAATFGVLALERHFSEGKASRWLAPAFYALALLSGEASLAVLGYIGSHAVFVERGPGWARARSVAPFLFVTVAWRAAYTLLGYGSRGSGLYLDPAREPVRFLSALLERGPVLFLGQLLAPPAELYNFLPASGARFYLAFAYAFLALTVAALAPLLARSQLARFWAGGTAFSIVTVSTTHPANRLLFFVGLGVMPLLAELWDLASREWEEVVSRGASRLSRAYSVLMMVGHLLLAPVALPLTACSVALTSPVKNAFADVGPDVAGRDAIFVTAPDYYSVRLMRMQKAVDHEPSPRRWRVLSYGPQDVVVKRIDERSLELRYEGGLLGTPLMELYRDRRIPMAPGDTVVLRGLEIRVTDVTPDGRPSGARFTFDDSLSAPSLRFYYWSDNHFRPFEVPPIGAESRLPVAVLRPGIQ